MHRDELRARLAAANEPGRRRLLERFLLEQLSLSLEVDVAELDLDGRFADLSTDSIRAVGFKKLLEDALSLKLRSTLLFDHPTPRALCTYLLEALARTPADARASAVVARRQDADTPPAEPGAIAVIGAACRLPGNCNDLDAFWRLLERGEDAIRQLDAHTVGPRADLLSDLNDAPPFAGLISDPAGFDARLFGISPKEALEMDPQQRVLLQVCWEALENAGIEPRSAQPRDTAVLIGMRGCEYHDGTRLRGEPAYQGTGASAASLAGRVAHCFGFTGAALAIDTACSASLVALHYAVQELRRGDCSTALVGGVNLLLSAFAMRATQAAHMLAPDGRCKTFSARADGYVRSEGCVVVVLKRLSDALADRDPILGVIAGTSVNHDGTTSGLTVPSPLAQRALIESALQSAGLAAEAVEYVECHGTGTELGDPIELQSLSEALSAAHRRAPLLVGSVKSQIGHTEPTAGLAGLLKVLLAMRHGVVPATLHCEQGLNAHVDWAGLGLEPALAPRRWPSRATPRFAGVSSFGFTGTNAHAVVASFAQDRAPAPTATERHCVLTLSASSPQALDVLAARWAGWLSEQSDEEVEAACRVSNLSRAALPYRRAWTARTPGELVRELLRSRGVARRGAPSSAPIVTILAGDAASWKRYVEELTPSWPGFARALRIRGDELRALLGLAPLESRFASLACACALGDALRAAGLEIESWAGSGSGLAAAHVLAGASLARVVAILSADGSFESLATPAVVSLEAARGAAPEAARVLVVSQNVHDAALALEPTQASLGRLTATLYEAGVPLNWATLRERPHAPLVTPPNYPFENERYWHDPPDASSGSAAERASGPALRELSSPALPPELRAFEIELRLDRDAWLAEHRVEGLPILPAAGVLEILRALGETLFGCAELKIRDLQLERAIILRESATMLSLVATADESHGFAVELSSRATGGRFTRHARAHLDAGVAAAVDPRSREPFEGAPVPAQELYALLRQAGVEHGPQFRALTELSGSGERAEARTAVRIKPRLAVGTIGLDACFITSAALLQSRGDLHARLPVGCDEVEFLDAPSRELVARVSLQPDAGGDARVDLDLSDPQERPIARVRGLRLGMRGRSAARAPAGPRAWALDWIERPLPVATRSDVPWSFEIVTDDAAFGQRFASVLTAVHGARADLVLLSELSGDGAALRAPGPRQTVWINRNLSGPEFLRAVLPALRTLLQREHGGPFWCVTRGAHGTAPFGPGAYAALSRSAVWGFGRTIAQEQPSLACTLIGFDDELTIEAECELLAAELRRNGSDPQVRYTAGVRRVPQLSEAETFDAGAAQLPVRSDASYLISGGTGGLGQLAALQLAAAGAGQVIVSSRNGRLSAELEAALERCGARLLVWKFSVGDRAALAGALAELQGSDKPLRGVIHAAGVVLDHTLERIEPAELEAVLEPKLDGGWHLHELTANLELDFFVAYSSLAGVLGSPAQAVYAAGNAFLDGLVEARNRARRCGVSLAWGPWSEAGMAAGSGGAAERLARIGVGAISNADGARFLERALGATGVFAVADVDWARYAAHSSPRAHGLLPLEGGAAAAGSAGELGAELRALAVGHTDEATRRLAAYLEERVLEVAGGRAVSEHDSFFELGLDSLQAVALRNRIERDLGIELSPSLIFDYPTLRDLRTHLASDHLGISAVDAPHAVPDPLAIAVAPDWDTQALDPLAGLEESMRSLEQELGS